MLLSSVVLLAIVLFTSTLFVPVAFSIVQFSVYVPFSVTFTSTLPYTELFSIRPLFIVEFVTFENVIVLVSMLLAFILLCVMFE